MANHKFEYVISGVDLSEEQKTAINAAIASAVSGVLIGTGSRGVRDLVEGELVGAMGSGGQLGTVPVGLLFPFDGFPLGLLLDQLLQVQLPQVSLPTLTVLQPAVLQPLQSQTLGL